MSLYQNMYQKYYFPFFETYIKGRKTSQIYKRSIDSQWLSHEDLMSMQMDKLKALLVHAGEFCPYYKQLFAENSFDPINITSIADLRKLPLLTKDIIREKITSLYSALYKENIWHKSTGGSTGQPLHFGYTSESYDWRVSMSKRGYTWAGAIPGAKQAYIWGVQLGNTGRIGRLKERLHHFVDRQLYFNCFNFDAIAMDHCIAELNRYKPSVIIGYTNPLYSFAQYLSSKPGLQFVPQGVITAAEKVHPYQRKVLEQVFGAKVFNTYGSREFMLIAAECEKHEGLHISAENLIVEIVKDDGTLAKEGETGKIVVTDLHNYGMPFIRYEIGDLGIATSKNCSCSRGLPMIADVVGRSLDVIRTPEGKVVPGEFFPHLFKDYPEIARFQVIQEKLDCLVIKLVPITSLSNATLASIRSEVQKILGQSMFVDYKIVADIPLTASGKYRVTVSMIDGECND